MENRYKKKFGFYEILFVFLTLSIIFGFGLLLTKILPERAWMIAMALTFLILSLVTVFYSFFMLRRFRKIGLMDKNKPLLR
jgi:uncharacterized membrane protein YesL